MYSIYSKYSRLLSPSKGFYFESDDKSSSGKEKSEGDDTDDGKTSGGENGKSKTGDSKKIEITEEELQKKFDDLAGKIRAEEQRKRDKEIEDEKRKAEQAEAKSKGEYEKLYNTVNSELEKTKSYAEKLESDNKVYVSFINSHIDNEVADWPVSVKKTDPGTSDLNARMKWVEQFRDMATQLMKAEDVDGEFGEKNKSKNKDNSSSGKDSKDKKEKGEVSAQDVVKSTSPFKRPDFGQKK